MAEIRIRIELQRNHEGVELSRLPRLAEQAWRLVRMVAEDSGVARDGSWVAGGFYEQGLGFDVRLDSPTDVDPGAVEGYLGAIDSAARAAGEGRWAARGVREETVLQLARLADIADEGESIRIGLLNGAGSPDWRQLPRDMAHKVIAHFDEEVEYRGTLQGVIHAIFKESDPPYFRLRDFASARLVRCELRSDAWADVHHALKKKDAAVFVTGWAKARRIDRRIYSIKVERLRQGRVPLSSTELANLFGAAPGWTGDLSTEAFVDVARSDGDEPAAGTGVDGTS